VRDGALFLAALLVSTCAVVATAAEHPATPTVVGEAFDRDDGRLVYREYHFCSPDGLTCTVDYRDGTGQPIAFKELDYTGNPYGPALVMRDLRSGGEEVLAFSDRTDLVVDAGFDNFVRSRWEELNRGETVVFPFQVVGIGRPLKMRANAMPDGCEASELCLQVSVDSWFLGLLAEPIELSYSRTSRRLLRFSGVSNLRDGGGRSHSVDILYDYTPGVSF